MPEERILPSSVDSEEAVLGSFMMNNDIIDECREILQPEMFYTARNREVYRSICLLYDRDEPVDSITVVAELMRLGKLDQVGAAEVSTLAGDAGSPYNTKSYARHIRDDYVRRQLIVRAERTQKDAYGKGVSVEELLSRAGAVTLDLELGGRNGFQTIQSVTQEALRRAEKKKETPGELTGFSSGNHKINDITDGFQRTDQIILAGRPGMGKSAIAWNLAREAARSTSVLWQNLEMSNLQIGNRALASEAQVDSHMMRRGYLGKTDFGKLPMAAETFADLPIILDERSRTLEEIRGSIRMAVKQHDVGFVVIDYLQLVVPPKDSYGQREQDVAQISASLKATAKRQNVCILLLSQLSRALESRKDKRPVLSDLRESGSIEQDADMVMFLYRDSYYAEETEDEQDLMYIAIAKQRTGPTGTVRVTFDLKTGRMAER